MRHSLRELGSATRQLRAAPRVPGTAWVVDYRSNEVVVRGDSTVSAADWSELTDLADGIGGFVRTERTEGTFTTRVNGALPILSTAGRCSAGFNVTDGTADYILTAGHCGPDGSVWFADGRGGGRWAGRWPAASPATTTRWCGTPRAGRATGRTWWPSVTGRGCGSRGVGEAAVGQRVFRSGSSSGLRDGEVTALDATVNYPEGTVSGLIETNVCAEPGDSGGPLFSEGIALGVTSGGSGDCRTGGTTFFQPLPRALSALGVQLITSAPQTGQGVPPASSGTQNAVAPPDAAPGAPVPVPGEAGRRLLARLTDPRIVGPGLLVVGGSLTALAATRWIRTEQDRKAYQRRYSATWG
ncbi:S1 family peptidase [Streptomyces cinereospinus]